MDKPLVCDLCHKPIIPHSHYVVRVDVFADPSVPAISTEQLQATNFDETFAHLIEQMKDMTEDQLQDQVHRRFEFRICPACHPKFLANPLGKPRTRRSGEN